MLTAPAESRSDLKTVPIFAVGACHSGVAVKGCCALLSRV